MADSLSCTTDARYLILKDVLIFLSRLAALDSWEWSWLHKSHSKCLTVYFHLQPPHLSPWEEANLQEQKEEWITFQCFDSQEERSYSNLKSNFSFPGFAPSGLKMLVEVWLSIRDNLPKWRKYSGHDSETHLGEDLGHPTGRQVSGK